MHGLTQSALLKAMGWSLFNSLWQMSLLWAIYHLFVLCFREASAKTRHALAFVLLSAGAGWTLLTFITTYWMGPETGAYLLPASLQTYGNRLLSVSRWFIEEGLSWCSCCYLLILGGLLLHYVGHYLHSRRITKNGLSKIAPGFRVFVSSTARSMGISSDVTVHLSSLVDVPVTLGFLKPVILLPIAMITHLTTQQVEAILVHELAHIRRKDYLINLVVTAMELLFFFNPFARMLIRQLKKEREHCCDDLVLQFRYEPHAYVSALLSLARHHRQGRLAVAATGDGEGQLLLQRARKILQQHRTDDRPGVRPLFLLVLTMGMTLFFWGPRRITPPPPPPPALLAKGPGTPRPSIETNDRPILNKVTPTFMPPVVIPDIPTTSAPVAHARHRTRTHAPAAGNPNDNAISWYNTTGPSDTPAPAYADLVIIDSRDYSIGAPTNDDQPPTAPPATNQGFPFVPQSSFSFHYTDTLAPEDRLAIMQLATENAIRTEMGRLREDLTIRMKMLKAAQMALEKPSNDRSLTRHNQSTSRQQLSRLIDDQLRLQRQYLIKLDSLQRQLKMAVHRLTTVYI